MQILSRLDTRHPQLVTSDLAEEALVLLVLLKDTEKAFPHLPRLLAGVNSLPDTGLLVIPNDRCGLLVVCDKSLLKRLSVVIRSLNQRLASDIILHILLGWIKDLVVRSARGWVNQTASYPRDKKSIVDLKLNSMLQLLIPLLQHLV